MNPVRETIVNPALQRHVLEWFGKALPDQTAEGQFEKLKEEFDELVAAVESGDDLHIHIEAADMFIVLLSWCHSAGIPLNSAVTYKMNVNRSREWSPPNEKGVQRHV